MPQIEKKEFLLLKNRLKIHQSQKSLFDLFFHTSLSSRKSWDTCILRQKKSIISFLQIPILEVLLKNLIRQRVTSDFFQIFLTQKN
jgi:hypothetical protein